MKFLLASGFFLFNLSCHGSEHFWRYSTEVGSLHYWNLGVEAGSEYYWKTGLDRGSSYFWKYGTKVGSEYFWKYGKKSGSEFYWLHGRGPGSLYFWKYGRGAGSYFNWTNGRDPSFQPFFVALCMGGALNIEPCQQMSKSALSFSLDNLLLLDSATLSPMSDQHLNINGTQEVKDAKPRPISLPAVKSNSKQ